MNKAHQVTAKQLLKNRNTIETIITSSTNKRLIVKTNIKLRTVSFIVLSGNYKEMCKTIEEAVKVYNKIQ